jgi:hypothetical protein
VGAVRFADQVSQEGKVMGDTLEHLEEKILERLKRKREEEEKSPPAEPNPNGSKIPPVSLF